MIANPNIQILEAAVARLGTLAEKMAFVGGCATGLLLTDPAASPVRATLDVDVIVEVATLARYYWLSDQLRHIGLSRIQVRMHLFVDGKPMTLYWMSCLRIPRFLVSAINGSRLHTKLLNGLIFLLVNKYGCCKPPISSSQNSRPLHATGRMII